VRLGRPGRRPSAARSSGARRGRPPAPGRRSDAHPRRTGRGLGGWRVPRPGLTPTRAAAVLGLLVAIGATYGLVARPTFTLTRTEVPALRWTTADALVAAIGTPDGTNLFRIRTGDIEARIEDLPGVASASVEVSLPDTLVVRVQERVAILVWAVGERRFLVDRDGVLFAAAPPDAGATGGLPMIADARDSASTLAVGSTLDPIDLDAATRLGSLLPSDLDSSASTLVLSITDASGFVMGTVPRSWVAVFGLYTPSLRTPAIIPGQVRLLRSLLYGRESTVERAILATEDRGTVTLKATPAP
jgi:cell division protein FtsQ